MGSSPSFDVICGSRSSATSDAFADALHELADCLNRPVASFERERGASWPLLASLLRSISMSESTS